MKEFPPENPKMYEASISEARGADRKRARKKEEKWEAKERIFAQRKGERGLEQKGQTGYHLRIGYTCIKSRQP